MITTNIAITGNLRDPSRPWSLQWQTASMAAPSFWYFATEADAKREEAQLQLQHCMTKDLR